MAGCVTHDGKPVGGDFQTQGTLFGAGLGAAAGGLASALAGQSTKSTILSTIVASNIGGFLGRFFGENLQTKYNENNAREKTIDEKMKQCRDIISAAENYNSELEKQVTSLRSITQATKQQVAEVRSIRETSQRIAEAYDKELSQLELSSLQAQQKNLTLEAEQLQNGYVRMKAERDALNTKLQDLSTIEQRLAKSTL